MSKILDALNEINTILQSEYEGDDDGKSLWALCERAIAVATKALSDYASTTKEGLRTKEDIRALAGHPDAIPRVFIDWFEKGYLAASSAPESGGEENWMVITPHLASCLLKCRDALVVKDYDEAYHWLYQVADPSFDRTYMDGSGGPWVTLEKLADDFVPSVQSSDVKPVASIEQDWRSVTELTDPKGVILVYFKTGKVFAYDCDHTNGKAIINVIEQNKSALYKQIILPKI